VQATRRTTRKTVATHASCTGDSATESTALASSRDGDGARGTVPSATEPVAKSASRTEAALRTTQLKCASPHSAHARSVASTSSFAGRLNSRPLGGFKRARSSRTPMPPPPAVNCESRRRKAGLRATGAGWDDCGTWVGSVTASTRSPASSLPEITLAVAIDAVGRSGAAVAPMPSVRLWVAGAGLLKPGTVPAGKSPLGRAGGGMGTGGGRGSWLETALVVVGPRIASESSKRLQSSHTRTWPSKPNARPSMV